MVPKPAIRVPRMWYRKSCTINTFRYGSKTCNYNAGWCHLCAIRNLLPLLCSRNVVSQCDTKTRYHKYCTTIPVAVICFLTRNLVPDLSRCPQLVGTLGTLGHYIFRNLVPAFFDIFQTCRYIGAKSSTLGQSMFRKLFPDF